MERYLRILCSVMIMGLCTTPLLAKNSRLEQEVLDRQTVDDDGCDDDKDTDITINTMDMLMATGIIGTVTLTTAYFGLKQYYNIDLLEKIKNLSVESKKPDPPSRPTENTSDKTIDLSYDVYLP